MLTNDGFQGYPKY